MHLSHHWIVVPLPPPGGLDGSSAQTLQTRVPIAQGQKKKWVLNQLFRDLHEFRDFHACKLLDFLDFLDFHTYTRHQY